MTLEFIVSTHRAHILLVDYCAGKFLLFWFSFLADRTNGHAIDTVLRLSVCRL